MGDKALEYVITLIYTGVITNRGWTFLYSATLTRIRFTLLAVQGRRARSVSSSLLRSWHTIYQVVLSLYRTWHSIVLVSLRPGS